MEKIDRIFYINLDHRKDRKEHIENEIRKIDPNLEKTERFNAVYSKFGFIGCAESHLEILKKSIKNGYTNVMVLEDDFTFYGNDYKDKIRRLTEFDDNFNLLLLGRNLIHGNKLKEDIIEVLDAQTTSGYIMNKRIFENLLKVWERGLVKLKKNPSITAGDFSCDITWKELQGKNKKIYTTEVYIGKQAHGYSDIEKRIVTYHC